jgi:hypothetical protein
MQKPSISLFLKDPPRKGGGAQVSLKPAVVEGRTPMPKGV